MTDTYYEQAYIARYLGLALVEGGDLTVEDGRLRLRTVEGPALVDVLWRRMDGAWADPLELKGDSRLGTPGLLGAVREGRVTMVNALGAGVIETQALMAFLPALAPRMTGRPLLMPNVATWWCGGGAERAYVKANLGRMTVGPALARGTPFETDAPHAVAGGMRNADDRDVGGWIDAEGPALVGKEMVTLSTTPAWEGGRLVPRPMTIRVFLARSGDGWLVMPGGFGRVGRGPDPHAVALREGGSAADVWVLSDGPVEPVTLIAGPSEPLRRADDAPLPSRAADNFLWLGRYAERAEGVMRLHRAWHARWADGAEPALLDLVAATLDGYGVAADEAVAEGLRRTLDAAVRAAGQVRDRFSVDGWAALADLQKSMGRLAATAEPGADAAAALSVLLRKGAGFAGLVHENMVRAPAWQFLSLGRSLERAAMTADFLAAFADPRAPAGSLDLMVEVGDSAMTHRRRYAAGASRGSVVDLLALDEENPRALRFQASAMADRVAALAGRDPAGRLAGVAARAVGIEEALGLHDAASLDTAALKAARGEVLAFSAALGEAVLG